MHRVSEERFVELVAEAVDSLPQEFRMLMKNVAVLAEDYPPEAEHPLPRGSLILGHFIGTPATQKSVFNLPGMPDRVVLYQKNIEAVCQSEAELQRQIRLTVIHEVGHFFGLSEDELRHV